MSSISSLRERNRKQSLVIRLLSEAVNDKEKKKQLLENVEKHEIPNHSNSQIQNQIKHLIESINSKRLSEQSNREQELRELIRIQENEYDKLTKQIEEYQKKAAEFEAEIERNEAEKQALINNLRNRDSFNAPASPKSTNNELASLFGSSMKQESDEVLEQKIKEADEEIESLTQELDTLNKTLEEKQEE